MSYGILVENVDGRTQIDETYSNLYFSSTTEASAAAGAAYPPSGVSLADFVFARAKSNGHVAVGVNDGTDGGGYSGPAFMYSNNLSINRIVAPTSGFGYYVCKKFSGNISASTSGYGLEVYNSSSQVVFSTNSFSANFKILAAGVMGSGTFSEIPFPSATTTYSDLTKVFVLMNNTEHTRVYVPVYSIDYEETIGYRYEFVSGNAGRVHVCKKGGNGSNIGPISGGETISYLIVEIKK